MSKTALLLAVLLASSQALAAAKWCWPQPVVEVAAASIVLHGETHHVDCCQRTWLASEEPAAVDALPPLEPRQAADPRRYAVASPPARSKPQVSAVLVAPPRLSVLFGKLRL